MKTLDVTVALGMIVGGAAMRDAQADSGFRRTAPK
jgi:hypothetical protein